MLTVYSLFSLVKDRYHSLDASCVTFFDNLGGFTYFQDCSSQSKVTCYGSLKSPRIFPGTGWKCFQFWYYLGSTRFISLQVSLLLNETQLTIWTTNSNQRKSGSWAYARLPIDSSEQPYQVHRVKPRTYN